MVLAGGVYLVGFRSTAQSAGRPGQTPGATAQPTAAGSSSPAATMLAADQVAPRSAVPWTLVGRGWALAQYTTMQVPHGTSVTARPTTLYLVDPLGGRYRMYRWPSGLAHVPALLDWSGDRTRALFWSEPGAPNGPVVIDQLELATGGLTRFTLPAGTSPVGYTRPDGLNLLVIGTDHGRNVVQRYGLNGKLAATLAAGSSVAGSPDGTTLAIGTGAGIAVVSNAGGRPRQIRVPGMTARSSCHAVRWWSATTVLAGCVPPGSGGQQLWLVPAAGAVPSALTPVRVSGPDLGDSNAWRLASGLYVQAAGAGCGTFVARQAADGSATPAAGQAGGVDVVVAVVGSRMLVRAGAGGCPGGTSLIWFNPVTGTSRMLLASKPGEVGVTRAVPYGGVSG